MTTEFVLILAIYAFVLLGVFKNGPKVTFDKSAPRLAAMVERDLAVGKEFRLPSGKSYLEWKDPNNRGGQ